MPTFKEILLPLLLAFPPATASASYYDRKAEGWFWYEQLAQMPEEEPEEPEQPEEPSVIAMEVPEPSEPIEPKAPPALSAAWFRENLQTYIDKAIDEPTPENVEAYFLLQRVMMDKAQAFSEASQRVVQGDPLLDESIRRSLDPTTSAIQERLSNQRRESSLQNVLQQSGIAFFFSQDCDLCDQQASILDGMAQRFGLEVLPISLDGHPLRSGLFADSTIVDGGQAESLGIDSGMGVFLMVPPATWVPIAFAPTTQEDLVSRILVAGVEESIITEAEFNKTRPINIDRSLAGVMSLIAEDGELPEDPRKLIELLRSTGYDE